MYVFVRTDLPPGAQLAQAVHAAVEYTLEHPARVVPTVVVLAVADEDELLEYADICCGWNGDPSFDAIPFTLFHEPDLPAHTALAAVDDGARFSNLPLAGAAHVT